MGVIKLQILAFGAHPDDVELACSGTLIKHIALGDKVGVIDLTRGELGSRGNIETRALETESANQILGIQIRENMEFEDGFFENTKENICRVISVIRHYQPDIVLINAPSDRHPDHGRASRIVKESCFLAGLIKIKTLCPDCEDQQPWRPKRIFHYIQDKYLEPDFVVDISDVYSKKLESIKAYKSQFFNEENTEEPETYISKKSFLSSVESRSIAFGKRIGVLHAEGFLNASSTLGFNDLSHFLLPDFT